MNFCAYKFADDSAANSSSTEVTNPVPGESIGMDMRIQNNTDSDLAGLVATLSSTSTYITFTKASFTYGSVSKGNYQSCYSATSHSPGSSYEDGAMLSASSSYFAFTVSSSTPADTTIPVSVAFADSSGNKWTSSFSFTVVANGANPVYNASLLADDGNGNGDNVANPGETLYMDIRVQNSGTNDITGLKAKLIPPSPSPYLTFIKDSYTYGSLAQGYYSTCYNSSGSPSSSLSMSASSTYAGYEFTIAPTTPDGTVIPISIAFSDSRGSTWTGSFTITVARMGVSSISLYSYSGDLGYTPTTVTTTGTFGLDMRILNSGAYDVYGLKAKLASSSTYITFLTDSFTFGKVTKNYYKTCSYPTTSGGTSNAGITMSAYTTYFKFTINDPSKIPIDVTVTFTDMQGDTWTGSIQFTVP